MGEQAQALSRQPFGVHTVFTLAIVMLTPWKHLAQNAVAASRFEKNQTYACSKWCGGLDCDGFDVARHLPYRECANMPHLSSEKKEIWGSVVGYVVLSVAGVSQDKPGGACIRLHASYDSSNQKSDAAWGAAETRACKI